MKKIIPLCDPLLKRSIDLINRSSDSDDHYPLKRQRTYQKDNLDIFANSPPTAAYVAWTSGLPRVLYYYNLEGMSQCKI